MSDTQQDKNYFEAEGFDLDGRILTEEEMTRPLTWARFDAWMRTVGEDYVDQCSIQQKAVFIFIGYLMHQYPQRIATLLELANDRTVDAQCIFEQLYQQDEDGNYNLDDETAAQHFYTDYAAFLNNLGHTKAQTNANLILVMEHYKA